MIKKMIFNVNILHAYKSLVNFKFYNRVKELIKEVKDNELRIVKINLEGKGYSSLLWY